MAQQYGHYNRRFALYGLAGELLIESNWMPPCGGGCETPPEGERARFVYFAGRKVFAAVSATPLGVQGPLKATTPNRLGSRADHYPYGEQKGAGPPDNDKDHFTTYRRDQTGLEYAWNRYYSSTMGRFTTADPYSGSAVATMPESWNRYAYVGGNPVNRMDPSGLMWGFMSGGGYDWVACAMDPFGAMSTNWLTCGQSPWSEEMWSVLGPSFGITAWGTPWGSTGPSSPPGGGDGSTSSPPSGEDDDPDSDAACFAQLKFRSVEDDRARVVGATHAFWWVQDRTGNQAIISGGPQRGFLRVWVVPGDTNGLDNKSQTTHFSTLVSSFVCDSVDRMLRTAGSFPGSSIHYRPFGPNSNSAVRYVGEAGGFIVSAPPGSIGWDMSLLTRPHPVSRPRVISYANR